MNRIEADEREILRSLARRKRDLAESPKNERIFQKWRAQEPTVRLLFSNFPNEVVTPRMCCRTEKAREIEASLLSCMVGRELFDDDTPLSATYDVCLKARANPFGASPRKTRIPGSIGFHIEPITDDIEADFDLFRGGSFEIDEAGTREACALADDVFGDILPSRVQMFNLTGAMTNPLVQLIGLENYYLAMKDAPEALHALMDMAAGVYERFYDELEARGLLLPTVGDSPISQESFAFTDELPSSGATSARDVWGFLEAQETTAASPDAYGEFVYPYMDRLARRFGLLSYGCCERVDNLWEKYLSRWKNLRKLSVSPFNDAARIGEFLRGSRVVFYSKPRAEHVTNPGPLDEERIRTYFRQLALDASGCRLEVAQREVGTIYGDFERGRRYVELARETVNRYWQP